MRPDRRNGSVARWGACVEKTALWLALSLATGIDNDQTLSC
jgi:hypothetical protein